jgi:hypothetical protein
MQIFDNISRGAQIFNLEPKFFVTNKDNNQYIVKNSNLKHRYAEFIVIYIEGFNQELINDNLLNYI